MRAADLVLLAFSLVFFGWGVLTALPFFFGYILTVYFMGWLIARVEKRNAAKALAIGLVMLLGVLYVSKYHGFVASKTNALAGRTILPEGNFLSLLGISFLTFAAISYLIDVYRGLGKAGNLLDVALYLSFFPKMVSGPIVLWRDFDQQISGRTMRPAKFVSGLNRIMIGFGKKLILADTFGLLCSEIQSATDSGISMLTAWGCAFIYMLQIYYDFSGYSDIAIGLSRLFGFEVKENFDFPYLSTSIAEFWRRWHISLGTWFREYIYIPLGGNRRGKLRTLLNIAVVFFLTGLWHGSGMRYICWGMMHGMCRMAEKCLEDTALYRRTPKALKYCFTMLVVMLGWEVFRLESLSSVIHFLGIMFGLQHYSWIGYPSFTYSFTYFFTTKTWLLMIIAIAGATVPAIPKIRRLPLALVNSKGWFVVQETGLIALMVLSVIVMVNSEYSPFIYFRY